MSKIKAIGGSGSLLGTLGGAGLGVAVGAKVISSAINTTGRVAGTITGDKLSESRMIDLAKTILNSFMSVPKMYTRMFELQRELERVDVKRAKANTYMPYRHGDRGITI